MNSPTDAGREGLPPNIPASRQGLLSKIRVLDLSRIISGPWATQLLGDFGADVIKVERPGSGDDVREQGPYLPDSAVQPTRERATFLAMNRAKRSITIDIAQPEGQALIRRLAGVSDVLVENFKSGDLARYGLDHATLCAANPRLIYCSITGFGQTGPYAKLPGYDLIFQAMGGVMSVTGVPDGQPGAGPQRAGYPVSDVTAGFYATIGVLAALASPRHRLGPGPAHRSVAARCPGGGALTDGHGLPGGRPVAGARGPGLAAHRALW